MTTLVDGVVFENNHQIGIWRIFYEVMRRTADRVDYTLWLRNRPVQPLPPGVRVVADVGRRAAPAWDAATRARRFLANRLPPPAAVRAADVFHSTFFTRALAGPVPVVSVYDMIAERQFAVCSGWAARDMAWKRAAIESAALCACISRATADDLLAHYPGLAGRVRVVPLGADHLAGPAPPGPASEPAEPYVLFVGYRDEYKNFWVLPRALRDPRWPRGVVLRVAGRPPADHDLALLAAEGLTDQVRFLGRLTDEELRREYHGARAFVFPSLLEGFGLPVLEAQANGCPAVLSDIPVFREVAGDAARFFDPRLGERVAEAVAEVCEPDIRRRLVEAGYENVRRFRWDRTAELTLQVYAEAVRLRGGGDP